MREKKEKDYLKSPPLANPSFLVVIPENIPLDLRNQKAWVLFKGVEDPDRPGKLTKVPFQCQAATRKASCTDSSGWADFSATYTRYADGGGFDGIGFMLSADDDLTGIDIDNCRNPETGEFTKEAQWIIDKLDSYSEISPSGKGVRIFVEGQLPPGSRKRKGNVEIYDEYRYLTVTGHVIGENGHAKRRKIEYRLNELQEVYDAFLKPKPEEVAGSGNTHNWDAAACGKFDGDIGAIIEKASKSKNGGKFVSLFAGNTGDYPSHSEADQAFCNMLAFWFNRDPVAMDTVFRQSGLIRKKWDEPHYGDGKTYGEVTILKAIAATKDTYNPGKKEMIAAATAVVINPPPKNEMVITADELATAKLTPSCIVRDLLYCDVACLVAPGGTGKTSSVLNEMICITLGRPLYGLDICKTGWNLYVSAEDSREILIARLREIMREMSLNDDEVRAVMNNVLIWDVTGEQIKLIEALDGNIVLTALADSLITTYKDNPPVQIVFDPAISFGAGESYINDNEQGLITAARRIVRGLRCCVRYIAHTGKVSARGKMLDQYTSRGGSALPDGTRMTAVMQAWKPGEDNNLKLPPGLTHSAESSITVLARPKLSYSRPNLPNIWIKRTGWKFEHVTESPISKDERDRALLDQVERFIHSDVKKGIHHRKKSLEESMMNIGGLKRNAIRSAIEILMAHGRVVMADLPKEKVRGNWKAYLTTPKLAEKQKMHGDIG